ncbi:MAG: hypothetical protein KAT05_12610, partial [Spirochaetes bacterium]|nr:hypothetical protein [Spirochaetota bacterium]
MKKRKKVILLTFKLCIITLIMSMLIACPMDQRDPESPPDNLTSIEYEAEEGTIGDGAEIQDEGGTICIGSMGSPGAWNEISEVHGFTGGEVTLTITYATDKIDPTKSLYVNDEDVMQITFPHSGGWTIFTTIEVKVTLKAGTTNKIKLQNDTDDSEGVNIDKYMVTGSGSAESSSSSSSSSTSSSSTSTGD